jgi:hypothetical protein
VGHEITDEVVLQHFQFEGGKYVSEHLGVQLAAVASLTTAEAFFLFTLILFAGEPVLFLGKMIYFHFFMPGKYVAAELYSV